jgi:anti-sigma-K factor RskA
MSAMNHQEARELLALAALGALSADDEKGVEAHIAWCADCRKELAELRDVAAGVGASIPSTPMDPERKQRVLARLQRRIAHSKEMPSMGSRVPPKMRPSGMPWLAAAAAVLIAIAGGWFLGRAGEQRNTAQQLARADSVLQESAARLAEQKATLDALTGPGVKVINAAAAGVSQPYARMFWDQPANKWTFVAYNLPANAPGRTYQLWLITKDQKKVSAGTFAAAPDGKAFVRATYALASDSLVAIAVTDEPAGGSKQPSTTPFLVGAAGK